MVQKDADIDWFKDIFDKYYEYIRNFLYYLSGDISLAEDLTQDVFLHLWEDHRKVNKETLKPYLFTVAKNKYFKHHRRKVISLNFTSTLKLEQENESPDFLMELKEFDLILQKAIATVPDKTRAIFLMSRIDQMAYSEIASNLDISVKAVEKHMNKALKTLKDKLDRKL